MRLTAKAAIFLLLIFTTSCSLPEKKPQPQKQSSAQQQVQVDPALAARAMETARQVKGVDDSTAVVMNKEISAAIKVSGLDRLRLKSIKQQVHGDITKMAGGYKVYVTSDKKLYAELQKLAGQVTGLPGGKATGEIKTQFDKINKGMRG